MEKLMYRKMKSEEKEEDYEYEMSDYGENNEDVENLEKKKIVLIWMTLLSYQRRS